MTPERVQRKLTTILAADVEGYTRLMRADEETTLKTLGEYREIIDALIARHDGRIFSTGGDSILVEYGSAVEAVRCAISWQEEIASRNAELADDRKLMFRIGINVGDVMVRDEDLFGDGVNVAARLEGLAQPGGICASASVVEQVKHKLSLGFEDLGPQEVKNIAEPISVYRLDTGMEAITASSQKSSAAKRWRRPAIAAGMVVLIAAVGLVIWRPWGPEFEPASIDKMAYPLPDIPSIAVLPFDNYSDDPKLDFFVSGLTEDLTTALSKAPGLFVIARNSAASYKGKSFKIKQVAEELGVQYVLKGSVQKEGERLRITAQLVDALSGRHLWAGRFDRLASDVFVLQDEITRRVFGELRVKLTEGDRARLASQDTRNFDSWLLRIEGYREYLTFTREGMIRARELWESSFEADPSYAFAVAGIALTHWAEAKWGWSASREESIRLATKLAERAIEINPNEPLGYQTLGNIFFLRNQPERAIELRRKAIEIAPNDFTTVAGLAFRLNEFGQEQEAVELFEHSLRLSPKPPWWVPAGYGYALHLVGRKQEAVEWLKKAIALKPKRAGIRARLAAVYTDLGQMNEATAVAVEVLRIRSKFTVSKYQKSDHFQDPKRNAWLKDLMVRAGLPE